MKILIVEDDADLREITTRSLEKERYVVSQAPDYKTALRKIEDYDYDCILLDIMLPDGSGLDLLEELHALGNGPMSLYCRPRILWKTKSKDWI